jgi:CheY-like chemotaxis protein
MTYALTVLLVEDSVDDVYFFERALKKSTIQCQLAKVWDGRAAIHMLQKAQAEGTPVPDLIFLDLKMPVLNGFEVLDWLRQQSFTVRPVVVVLSGSNQDADRRRALELGAAGYAVKPVTPEDLAARIQQLQREKESRAAGANTDS